MTDEERVARAIWGALKDTTPPGPFSLEDAARAALSALGPQLTVEEAAALLKALPTTMDARSFGAVAEDAETDCTPAFQAALDASSGASKLSLIAAGATPMTHHETHGARCICHLCQPLIDALREARPYVFNQTHNDDWRGQTADEVLARVDAALEKAQPRGARR